jgi:hypothetical protein
MSSFEEEKNVWKMKLVMQRETLQRLSVRGGRRGRPEEEQRGRLTRSRGQG